MIPNTDYPEKATSMMDLCSRLLTAPDRVTASLAELTAEDMQQHLVAGKMTIAEQVEHIALVSIGWSNILFEALDGYYITPRITFPAWQEEREQRARASVTEALRAFQYQNRDIAAFLNSLPPDDFLRPFRIVAFLTEPFQIGESVNWGLVIHADWHLAAIHRLRLLLGKPLVWMDPFLERYPKADPARTVSL